MPLECLLNEPTSAHDIFISYRRDGGEHLAGRVKDALTSRGFSVFMDVEDLKSGRFDDALIRKIQEARDVIVILTPGCLDRCKDPDDWFRREIGHAIKCKRNVVPIMDRDFQKPSFKDPPSEIIDLFKYNRLSLTHVMFKAGIDELISKFLVSAPHNG